MPLLLSGVVDWRKEEGLLRGFTEGSGLKGVYVGSCVLSNEH